ncbi:ribosome-associated protein [Amphibacillus marinus]|uniref:Ribosomal silencing factor RsfS n=1 Tax=Amphibacillus marinus TaxID=872970 RepID=A0A1H8NTH3_9BACI|nr:ribosome silencing factor [Amphibacillus marinus]SEO32852.1 ribosome-associated protein [Amphibacillus marinus]
MINEALLKLVVKACDDKRAQDIIALDMQSVSFVADYFVICDATNERQAQAIAREVKEQAEKNNTIVKRIEGFDKARWILIDLGDIVCHVFHQEERGYYNLEKLWGDAPIVQLALED